MTEALLQREVDNLIVRLKGLVTVRALLESRGASAGELSAKSDQIARVREELARRAKRLGNTAAAGGVPKATPR